MCLGGSILSILLTIVVALPAAAAPTLTFDQADAVVRSEIPPIEDDPLGPLPEAPDREPPVNLVWPAEYLASTGDIVIRARVIDPSGVRSVIVQAKGPQDAYYRKFPMHRTGDESWEVTIPDWDGRGDEIRYLVDSYDSAHNGPRRSGAHDAPFVANADSRVPVLPTYEQAFEIWLALMTVLAFVALGLLVARKIQGGTATRRAGAINEVTQVVEITDDLRVDEVIEELEQVVPEPETPTPLPVAARGEDASDPTRGSRGMTLVEVLAVLAITAVFLTASAVYLRPFETPLRTGAQLVEGMMKQARAKAIASTTAHRVRPFNRTTLVVESARSCSSAAWTFDPRMEVVLPVGVNLQETAWTVCFTSRGIASENLFMTLSHEQFGTQRLELLKGGAIKWLQ